MADFSHFNEDGRATMVDVGGKDVTERVAVAVGRILVNEQCFNMIKTGGHKKGDVLGTAQIAGIMAAKKTPDIIPMCHPIMITGANIRLNLNEENLAVEIEATVKCSGVTGVEMEALTAASAAALTIYDMCKAVQKDMVIDQIHLVSKSGGKSGDFVWGGDK
jgi:cyclic pyranopterin phosphate synthase